MLLCCWLCLPATYAQVAVVVETTPGTAVQQWLSGTASKADVVIPDALEAGLLDREPLARTTQPSAWQNVFVLSFADSAAARAALQAYQARADVAYAEPNYTRRLDGSTSSGQQDDPLLDSLHHLVDIRAIEAWRVTQGVPTVRVGVIDTGVWADHPDLIGQFAINSAEDINGNGRLDDDDLNGIDDDQNGLVDDVMGYDFVDRFAAVDRGDYRDPDPFPFEDNIVGGGRGHGTTVAGVIAAAGDNGEGIVGVAPGVRLVPLRAFGPDGTAEDDDIARAIIYAADTGIDVLNMSFGDVYDASLLRDAIAYAASRGVVMVASAGNSGGDAPHYPSDYPDVLSVAWLTGDQLGSRATHGIGVDLGAPGSGIFTTMLPIDPDADDARRYGRRSGSSVSAPQVAAAAALLRSVNPALTVASIRSILATTAQDIEAPGWDHETGAGRLNVSQALRWALPARVELTSPEHSAGTAGREIAIVGTVVHPDLRGYTLSYAEGTEDLDASAWTAILDEVEHAVFEKRLTRWDVGSLADGTYTLRLTAHLRNGRTVEDRRRVFIDRSPPVVDVVALSQALVDGKPGLAVSLRADDDIEAVLSVQAGADPRVFRVASDRVARDVVLSCCDQAALAGPAEVQIEVTNRSGLTWTLAELMALPDHRPDPMYVTATSAGLPAGYLLTHLTDFDRDGLAEVVMNRYREGWVGDTLATYEWAGDGFRPAASIIANVIPRDTGDIDGDGRIELLTQVAGATLVLEQPTASAYPSQSAFVDTTGLSNPFSADAVFGARLVDLDGDGRDELLSHNTTVWRIFGVGNGNTYEVLQALENPTADGAGEVGKNEYQEPEAIVEDLDGDGDLDLVVGDADGDLIVYHNDGQGRFSVLWFAESDRYQAGSRLAACDVDGDNRLELLAFKQEWRTPTQDREREPALGQYEWWVPSSDFTSYDRAGTVLVPGPTSRHGTATCADLDGDAKDELIVVHAPHLAIYGVDQQQHLALKHLRAREAGAGARSIAVTVGDVDGDGHLNLLVGSEGDETLLYEANNAVIAKTITLNGYAVSAAEVYLSWNGDSGVDSVSVFSALEAQPYERVLTTAEPFATITESREKSYRVAAWANGKQSRLSAALTIRPHDPARITNIAVQDSATVVLYFTEPMPERPPTSAFRLADGRTPRVVQRLSDPLAVSLRFTNVAGQSHRLTIADLADDSGTPVAEHVVSIDFPAKPVPLLLSSWDVVSDDRLRLTFDQPLDPSSLPQLTVEVTPSGSVLASAIAESDPRLLELQISDVVIGQPGVEAAMVLRGLTADTGARLGSEGLAISLSGAATSLASVYAYPNPVRPEQQQTVTFVGIPQGATLEVFTVVGELVMRREETAGSSRIEWDLETNRGTLAPSGVYLVRVTHQDESVLKKLAVIR
ncbi:MAG: S8 family serine peptidase [Bacteroidota bacterium]